MKKNSYNGKTYNGSKIFYSFSYSKFFMLCSQYGSHCGPIPTPSGVDATSHKNKSLGCVRAKASDNNKRDTEIIHIRLVM